MRTTRPLGILVALTAVAALGRPSFVEGQASERQCADGVVKRIEIDNRPVFPVETDDPRLMRWAFGVVNLLHVETTPSFVRRELLLKEGDCYDSFLASESRRVLEGYGFIDQVGLETEDDGTGQKTVRVWTRDAWSTQVDVGLAYDGGLNLERFQATETNFLGNGITAEVTYRARREVRDRNLRLFTPRLFGRTDADVRVGETRAGTFFFQRLNHGFVGEATRFSMSELFDRKTDFYPFATGGSESFSHVLVPIESQRAELAVGRRFGDPGRSWIMGVSLERSVFRRSGAIELVRADDFDGASSQDSPLPASFDRQVVDRAATRLALHLGLRRVRYEERVGLDALSDRDLVTLGLTGSLSVGRSLGVFVPEGTADADDTYGRMSSRLAVPVGPVLLLMSTTAEGAWAGGDWRDLLGQADVGAWVQGRALPGQTLFFRVSAAGAWRTSMPFQLSLGGREGVRSLGDDDLPGGRRLLVIAEDRIRFPWPDWRVLELGATVFADAGRAWPGDVPYGTDAGWRGSVGFGLRIVSPAGSRQIWRPEIAFPLGHDGSPVFRVTVELNKMRYGFSTPRFGGSRRFWRGAEEF